MSMSPLEITLSPKLDAALRTSGLAWEEAAGEEGIARTLGWLKRRLSEEAREMELEEPLAALLDAEDEDARVYARLELAELVEGEDDELADALWESTLSHGIATDDGDLVFEAASHLSAIAEENGEPLAAAEFFVDFLNWRRMPDHSSDPEQVQTAFDEIVRLAEVDGEPKIAAEFQFRQVRYTRLADADDERAVTGEWEDHPQPYASWS
jgi:hypothetical protein